MATGASEGDVHGLVLTAGAAGLVFAAFQLWHVTQVKLTGGSGGDGGGKGVGGGSDTTTGLLEVTGEAGATDRLLRIYDAIRAGADSFLFAEYKICGLFCAGFAVLVLVLVSDVPTGACARAPCRRRVFVRMRCCVRVSHARGWGTCRAGGPRRAHRAQPGGGARLVTCLTCLARAGTTRLRAAARGRRRGLSCSVTRG